MITSPQTPRTRKPARETHGTCYLKPTGNLTLEQALDSGDALLTIHADRCTNYTVLRLADPDGETVGFRMMKLTAFIVDRKVYDLDVTGKDWVCDCPDATFQNRACKHARALRAALASNGIIVITPKKPEPQYTAADMEFDNP
jgi:hypothetical protein